MNKSQLKTLLKHILLEIRSNEMIVNKDLPSDVMGAVNVESTHWDSPIKNAQWYKDIQLWSKDNLDINGRYKGEPLHNYGFLYKIGDFIPVTNRYSAMASWNQAKKSREINLKLGKPAGIEESAFINKVKQKLKEKTNPDGTYSDDMEDAIRMKKAEGLNEITKYFNPKTEQKLIQYFKSNNDINFDELAQSLTQQLHLPITGEQLYSLYLNVMGRDINEMTTSSAAGGQAGGTISVPAWGTKNKEGSPKAIQATKKMKGWKVAKSISTEGK